MKTTCSKNGDKTTTPVTEEKEIKNGDTVDVEYDKVAFKLHQQEFDASLYRQAHYGKGIFGDDR